MTAYKKYVYLSGETSMALSKSYQNPELNMPGYKQNRVQVHIAAAVLAVSVVHTSTTISPVKVVPCFSVTSYALTIPLHTTSFFSE